MSKQDSSGITQNGGLPDFSWVHHACGHAAYRHGVDANEAVFLIHQNYHKMLSVCVATLLWDYLADTDREHFVLIPDGAFPNQRDTIDGQCQGSSGHRLTFPRRWCVIFTTRRVCPRHFVVCLKPADDLEILPKVVVEALDG